MQSQEEKKYSAADIERYHNGGMSASEMHALEKAALDDPFLSDAIDGYVHTKTPADDVAFLNEQLYNKSRKAIPMQRIRPRVFLSIAAMVILLAGFGWLAYQLSANETKNIAVQKELLPQKAQPESPPSTDTVNTAPEETMVMRKAADAKQESTDAKTNSKYPRSNSKTVAVRKQERDNKPATDGNQTFSNPHAAAPLSNAERDMAASKISENVIRGQVIDVHNNAVPFATVSDPENNAIASTDAAGNFSIAVPDSNVTVAINSAGYQQQQITLVPTDSTTRIVLQPSDQTLNEVVVSSKNKAVTKGNRVQLEAAEPLTGWNRFNAYVDKNIEPPEDLQARAEANEVILSFDIDNAGNAVNVTVEKSACSSCDTTAVRIIKEGTKWKKTKRDVKAKARIRF